MKNKIIYLYILVTSLLVASCGDFLEPKSNSEFVPKDASSLNELLLGTAYPRNVSQNLNIFLNLLDDDVSCTSFSEIEVGKSRERWWAAYSWQPDIYELFEETGFGSSSYNVYAGYYTLILGTNAVLDYLEDIKDDENVVNLVKAQALTLRGYYYFILVNLFGTPFYFNEEALGVPLKLNSGIETTTLARSTVKEVYGQILLDLLLAEDLYNKLPEENRWRPNYRTSLPMVELLLSRVFLYMEDWENAIVYAEKVINNKRFQLFDLNGVAEKNDKGKYIYTNYHDYDSSPEAIWVFGSIADVTYMTKERGKNGKAIFNASKGLMESFDDTEGDLRKARYVVREQHSSTINGEMVYLPQAFGKIRVLESSNLPSGNFFGRSFRLAEAFLNLSEANAMIHKETGNTAAASRAKEALEKLRAKRFPYSIDVSVKITDADKLVEFVQRERRRELCFEDHRWFDLRRWGMKPIEHIWYPDENTQMVYSLKQDDPSYTLSFPPEAIDMNRDLEQNPLGPIPRVD